MIQIVANWYYAIGWCSVCVVQVALSAIDLHELAQVILPGMQEAAYLSVQLYYLAHEFKFALLAGIVKFGLSFSSTQVGGIDQALRL